MPAVRYSTWLANPSREPSTRPPTSTTIGWKVNGTCVNGSGKLICAADAVSTSRDDVHQSGRVCCVHKGDCIALPANNQQVLEWQCDAIEHAQSGGPDLRLHHRAIEPALRFGPGSAFAGLVVDDSDTSL